MSPHYDRHPSRLETYIAQKDHSVGGDAMDEAAEALRQAELEAVQPEVSTIDPAQLESLSIDELRVIAKELDVPEDRGKITEQSELIAAIRRRM